MANAALVFHQCARSQWVSVEQNVLRRLCYSFNTLKSVSMVTVSGIRYTMVDFIL